MTARRLYFSKDNNPTAPNNPALHPVKGSLWDSASVVRRALNTAPLNSALGAFSAAPSGSGSKLDYDVLNAQWTTGAPDGDFPYTGKFGGDGTTFSLVIGTQESNLAADFTLQVHVRVVSSDCSVVRGVLLDHVAAGIEYVAATQTRIVDSEPLAEVDVQAGDRIVVELGARSAYSGTTNYIAYLRVGDPTAGADFALTSGLTTDLRPWCEFSVDPFDGLPHPPTGLVQTDDTETTVDVDWTAPVTGAPPTSYEVRVDGGSETDVGLVLTTTLTGLTPATGYDVEVRSKNASGVSDWVLLAVATTDVPTPPGYYRIELDLGSHSWEIVKGASPAYGPLLPLSFGWDIADGVDYFPSQPSLLTGSFRVQTNDAADLADVVKGTTVRFRMYVDNDVDAEHWHWFDGVVTQLDGEFVPSSFDADKLDYRVTVYFADDTARLADIQVGYTADWPEERIDDRIDRIVSEAGISTRVHNGVSMGTGMLGWLPARSLAPISALEALRATLRDAADYVSDSGDWYGRYVFRYTFDDDTLRTYVYRRRLFADGSQQQTLDGGKVRAEGRWTKQPGAHAASWGIVNDTVFGTPDGSAPFVRKASLVMLPDAPDGDSAGELDRLGESMLPDGSTALDGWSTRTLTYLAYLDPDPVGPTSPTAMPGWASLPEPVNSYLVKPVIITPIGPELEVNGVDYLAGTLTGARLVIPPGGKFVVEFRLRAELLAGTDLP